MKTAVEYFDAVNKLANENQDNKIKQQTAVEWLYQKMFEYQGRITKEDYEQAKAMEKEQIMESRNNGIVSTLKGYSISNEDYYNETYNK
jgi:hypothetical protein